MIRMIQSRSAKQAKAYFSDALLKSDYYVGDQELVGSFHGRLVDRLGIGQSMSKEIFNRLAENIHPLDGTPLTPRKLKQRTVGYDINFHCPKSVSLLHVLSKDDHIIDAFRKAVRETMLDMESDSLVRVRKYGRDENRPSGEWLWGEFVHQTARPVKGTAPDPHLHCHCFTFNIAWDEEERQYKAGQFRNIKRDMPYYQARFHKRLSDNLIRLGYRIHRVKKSFEIDGVPQNVIDLFSKRRDEINRFAKEHNITDAKELDKLGARTRSKKQKGLRVAQLKKEWRRQIHGLGMNGTHAENNIIRHVTAKDTFLTTPEQCVDHALQHCFERASVTQDRRVLETAYYHAIGASSLSLERINKSFETDKRIIRVADDEITFCTTHNVLAEEERMIALAQRGKGKFAPFYRACPELKSTGEQADAIHSILTTKDQVSIICGKAGTGKTTLMKEAIPLIEATDKQIIIVAPTAQAARGVLRDEGFSGAETVAKFLSDKGLQNRLKDNVLWVDEAGLLGVQDMAALLQIAADKGAKAILGGDTGQHASVARGDALRLLSVVAGLSTAQVGKIYRQKHLDYRRAVQAISEGNTQEGFEILDRMGSIVELESDDSAKKLVADYVKAAQKSKSVLVICPTHKQGDIITSDIRNALKAAHRIKQKDFKVSRLVNLGMTEAEKKDIRNYDAGLVLQFNKHAKGIKRGSTWTVEGIKGKKLALRNKENQITDFAPQENENFDVFQQKILSLAKGDIVRVTRNGFDTTKKRLNNGQEFKVLGLDKKNRVLLQNVKSKGEYAVSKDFGHITHAYCLTSHASQGKTVDEVLIFQPGETFPATDLKQFYVSVSRGRNAVRIYTDDKEMLFERVAKPGNRRSATELIRASVNSMTERNIRGFGTINKPSPKLNLG